MYINNLREKVSPGPGFEPRAGDPGLNPGPGENFSLKLLLITDSKFVRFYQLWWSENSLSLQN